MAECILRESLIRQRSEDLQIPFVDLLPSAVTEYFLYQISKSTFVERFPELSLFYRLFSPLNSEMICIFPYFCPYAESAREIRGIFVALHINNWFSEPILI